MRLIFPLTAALVAASLPTHAQEFHPTLIAPGMSCALVDAMYQADPADLNTSDRESLTNMVHLVEGYVAGVTAAFMELPYGETLQAVLTYCRTSPTTHFIEAVPIAIDTVIN